MAMRSQLIARLIPLVVVAVRTLLRAAHQATVMARVPDGVEHQRRVDALLSSSQLTTAATRDGLWRRRSQAGTVVGGAPRRA